MAYPTLRPVIALLLLAPACNGDGGDPPGEQVFRCVDLPRPPSQDLLRLERVLPDIEIEGGVDLLQLPGDPAWWYVVTQPGIVHRFPAAGGKPSTVLDMSDAVVVGGEAGLLGMAFHPDFADNGELFLSYTAPGGDVFTSTVSRIRSTDGGASFDRATEEIVLQVEQPYSNHNGGHLAFGPDGMLYFGLGDGGSSGDPQGNAQDLDTLLGKIVRIDVDGGDPYAIPADNPFAGGGGRPEIWAWGLRNPWRFSFDSVSGALWAGDVGQNVWEEVDIIEGGKNYGWNVKEGPDCFGQDVCVETDLVDPVASYRNISSASVIAGVVYRGTAIPDIVGMHIYTDFYGGTIWGVNAQGEQRTLSEAGTRGLVSFSAGADGEVYALDYQGGIYKLAAAEPQTGPALPTKLSATGCVDPEDLQRPPTAAVPYEINHPFWSDGAAKQRWMMLPRGARITVGDDGDFDLPDGSVLVKHFALGDTPVETRLFVRHDDGAWAGYSYAWDPETGDATLLTSAATRDFAGQTWIYPGRDECMYCHSEAAGYTLGLEATQLQRTITGPDGDPIDQFDHLVELGLLAPGPSVLPLPAIDGDDPVDARARAYLHANCSQCHRPEGPAGRAKIDFRFATPLAEVAVCDANPRSGDLDIADARLLVPGDPARSIVSARMHSLGSTRMPGIGSAVVDEQGVALIDEWISGLAACP
jgi:uncharacterized repeat protein (TIGR03806 family)